MTPTDSAGRNDTRHQPHAVGRSGGADGSGTTGDRSARNEVPRAAGGASARGAQPSGQRTITICQRCRKRVRMVRNGSWYHLHNASEFCHPGDGTGRTVIMLRITPREA